MFLEQGNLITDTVTFQFTPPDYTLISGPSLRTRGTESLSINPAVPSSRLLIVFRSCLVGRGKREK